MNDRVVSRLSSAAFVVLMATLYLVSSCAGGSDSDSRGDPVAATVEPSDPDVVVDSGLGPSSVPPLDTGPSTELPPTGTPELLSDWGQLEVRDGRLVALDRVQPYTLNSALFSDYAHKLRTVWLPNGASGARYDPADVLDFPVGTVVTKTFYYPVEEGATADDPRVLKADQNHEEIVRQIDVASVRLVETRVLVRRDDGWHAFPYVWNEDETEATLHRAGDLQVFDFVADGVEIALPYVVPDVNQCANCHATDHSSGEIQPIGLAARHLNRQVDAAGGMVAQLDRWQELGLLAFAPAASDVPATAMWEDDSLSLEERARAYLDINCAHCHNPRGAADTSGLFLDSETEIGAAFGVCKKPVAAGSGSGGRLVGISPGEPDESIFVYRMESTDPASMMPELGRSLSHDEGVELVAEWIESLSGDC